MLEICASGAVKLSPAVSFSPDPWAAVKTLFPVTFIYVFGYIQWLAGAEDCSPRTTFLDPEEQEGCFLQR